MGIVGGGQNQLALQINNLRVGADMCFYLFIFADVDDPAVFHRDGAGETKMTIDCRHFAVNQYGICNGHRFLLCLLAGNLRTSVINGASFIWMDLNPAISCYCAIASNATA